MATLELYLLHPTNGARRRARIDDSMTAQEVINDLHRERFIDQDDYGLAIKGGAEIEANTTLRVAGVRGSDTLRIIPRSDAGAADAPVRT